MDSVGAGSSRRSELESDVERLRQRVAECAKQHAREQHRADELEGVVAEMRAQTHRVMSRKMALDRDNRNHEGIRQRLLSLLDESQGRGKATASMEAVLYAQHSQRRTLHHQRCDALRESIHETYTSSLEKQSALHALKSDIIAACDYVRVQAQLGKERVEGSRTLSARDRTSQLDMLHRQGQEFEQRFSQTTVVLAEPLLQRLNELHDTLATLNEEQHRRDADMDELSHAAIIEREAAGHVAPLELELARLTAEIRAMESGFSGLADERKRLVTEIRSRDLTLTLSARDRVQETQCDDRIRALVRSLDSLQQRLLDHREATRLGADDVYMQTMASVRLEGQRLGDELRLVVARRDSDRNWRAEERTRLADQLVALHDQLSSAAHESAALDAQRARSRQELEELSRRQALLKELSAQYVAKLTQELQSSS